MPKIIRILRSCSMKILVILLMISNIHLNNFKGDFLNVLIFLLPQILSYHNKPYINGKLIYSALRCCININFEKLTLMTGFVVQGYILVIFNTV